MNRPLVKNAWREFPKDWTPEERAAWLHSFPNTNEDGTSKEPFWSSLNAFGKVMFVLTIPLWPLMLLIDWILPEAKEQV